VAVPTERFEQVEVSSPAELRAWLEENHAQQESVWLVTWKKATGERYVSRDQVLDELLAFGWVDGVARALDEQRTMQLVSPRRAAHWAASYKRRVARLIEEGRMHPAGLRGVEEAKASGAWNLMDDVDALVVPADLAEALAGTQGAEQGFAAIPPSSRRFTLRWLKLARTEATRAARVARITELASRGERLPGS
jgi:uncharacterized protein YdeI (YjbR/CyaY-like superfamily)